MTLSAFLAVIILLAIGFVILYVLSIYLKYRKSSYKDASGNSFLQVLFDKGNYGEFLIFSRLEKIERHHRLLTNIYLPKSDGSTTEIDVLMIAETGIYVFESKNYSGWIFGDEKGRNWTQILENKQKNHFYNPVWQNNGHITALKYTTGLRNPELYKSYIAFSERCTLKKVTVDSHNVFVMKRDSLLRNVKLDMMSSPNVFDSGTFFGTDSIIYIPVTYFSVNWISFPSSVLREEKDPVWSFGVASISNITLIFSAIVIRMSSGGRILLLFFFFSSSGESA